MAQPRDFGFDDETAMLKAAAQRYLTELEPLAGLRRSLTGTEDPYRGKVRESYHDQAAWRAMRDLGWHLAAIPETSGGLGMGLVAAVAIQEEIGRAACPTPLTGTLQAVFVLREAVASAEAVASGEAAGDAGAGAAAQLAKIADGLAVGLALHGEDGSLETDSTDVTADGNRLSGTSWYVQDVQKADGFIVAARAPQGVGLYFVTKAHLEVRADRIVDLTRDQGRLVLDGVEAEVVSPPGEGAAVLARALPAVWTLIAADMAGAAEWQLMTTAEYARVRVQFDRPIGFFQAVKHPLVNMMIAADETRSLVYNAACAYDTDPQDAVRTAHLAKASASDTASFCSNRSTQLHGGIGFTWESDVQIYHKRQMHSQFLWGDGSWHRQRLAALL